MSGLATKVGRNAVMLSAVQVLNKLISVFFLVYVTRVLGDAGFGKYSFVYALTSFFMVFAFFGLSNLQVREVSRNHSLTSKYIANIFFIKAVFSVIALSLVIALSYLAGYDTVTATVLRIFGVAMFFNVIYTPFLDTFTAYERLEWFSGTLLFNHILTVIFGFFSLYRGYGLIGFAYAWLAAWVVTAAVSYELIRKLVMRPKWELDPAFCFWMLKEAWPFALSSLAFMIFFKVDTIILFSLKGDQATGWYNAAYRLLEALLFIPQSFMLAAYPTLSRLHVEDAGSFRDVVDKSFRYLLVLSLPFAVGGSLVAGPLVTTLFGQRFGPSAVAFGILIWSFVFVAMREGFIQSLNSAGRQRENFYTDLSGLFFNVALNLYLIPRYSFVGAAWATVISYVFVCVVSASFYGWRVGGLDIGGIVLRPLGSVLPMAVFLVLARGYMPMLPLVFVGAAVYLAAALAFKTIEPDTVRKVLARS